MLASLAIFLVTQLSLVPCAYYPVPLDPMNPYAVCK